LAVVYFFFVETSSLSLEQTATLLDGEDVKNQLVEQVAKSATAAAGHTEGSVGPEKKLEG